MGLEPQPYRLTVIQLYQLSYQVISAPRKKENSLEGGLNSQPLPYHGSATTN